MLHWKIQDSTFKLQRCLLLIGYITSAERGKKDCGQLKQNDRRQFGYWTCMNGRKRTLLNIPLQWKYYLYAVYTCYIYIYLYLCICQNQMQTQNGNGQIYFIACNVSGSVHNQERRFWVCFHRNIREWYLGICNLYNNLSVISEHEHVGHVFLLVIFTTTNNLIHSTRKH